MNYRITMEYDGYEREYFCFSYFDAITAFDAFSRVWAGALIRLYNYDNEVEAVYNPAFN